MDTTWLILIIGGMVVLVLALVGGALWITSDGYRPTRDRAHPPRLPKIPRHRAEDLDSPTQTVRGGHLRS